MFALVLPIVASAQSDWAIDDHIPPAPPSVTVPPMSDQAMADVMQMHDDAMFGMLKVDQFERAKGDDDATRWDIDAWYGGDFNKIWLRSEGERSATEDERVELFWDHAFASYWDWQLGARHDFGTGPSRDWAAVGVQGLAPYWFEIEATAYVGDQGRTAARVRAEYEILFTQRLILQPELEINVYGKSDPQRDVRAGLSDADFGLRLRYEFCREVAPYVGVVWTHRFADIAGRDATDTQIVAGLRFWF